MIHSLVLGYFALGLIHAAWLHFWVVGRAAGYSYPNREQFLKAVEVYRAQSFFVMFRSVLALAALWPIFDLVLWSAHRKALESWKN